MGIPPCDLGDFLLTYWTDAVLLLPEIEKLSSPQKRVDHFDPKSFLKVGLPLGIIRVGLRLDLRMSFDGHVFCTKEPARLKASIWS